MKLDPYNALHHMQKWIKDLNIRTKTVRCLRDIREMKTCTQIFHGSIHNIQEAETTQVSIN